MVIDRFPGAGLDEDRVRRYLVLLVAGALSPVLFLTAAILDDPGFFVAVDREGHVGKCNADRVYK